MLNGLNQSPPPARGGGNVAVIVAAIGAVVVVLVAVGAVVAFGLFGGRPVEGAALPAGGVAGGVPGGDASANISEDVGDDARAQAERESNFRVVYELRAGPKFHPLYPWSGSYGLKDGSKVQVEATPSAVWSGRGMSFDLPTGVDVVEHDDWIELVDRQGRIALLGDVPSRPPQAWLEDPRLRGARGGGNVERTIAGSEVRGDVFVDADGRLHVETFVVPRPGDRPLAVVLAGPEPLHPGPFEEVLRSVLFEERPLTPLFHAVMADERQPLVLDESTWVDGVGTVVLRRRAKVLRKVRGTTFEYSPDLFESPAPQGDFAFVQDGVAVDLAFFDTGDEAPKILMEQAAEVGVPDDILVVGTGAGFREEVGTGADMVQRHVVFLKRKGGIIVARVELAADRDREVALPILEPILASVEP